MIKFLLDDFNYIKRHGDTETFGYLFNVRGKSADYLIYKYQLDYSKVFVNCYMDKTIYIGSRQYDNKKSDCCDCEEDDIEELYNLLEPIMSKEDRINKYIQAQLDAGYIVLGAHDEDELEIVKDALDKQIAKHPYDKGNPDTDWHIICCPSCDRVFWNSGNWTRYEPKYCEKCGQKMNWLDWRSYTNT